MEEENLKMQSIFRKSGVLNLDQQMSIVNGEDISKIPPKELTPEDYLKQRDDLTIPSTFQLEGLGGSGGFAELTEIDTHTQEFTEMVNKMKDEFVNETKLLEGVPIPTYESILKKETQQSNK